MPSKIFAYIEKDLESDSYVAIVPGLPGAHTRADTLDELQVKLKEVVELRLKEMDPEKRYSLLNFYPEALFRTLEARPKESADEG